MSGFTRDVYIPVAGILLTVLVTLGVVLLRKETLWRTFRITGVIFLLFTLYWILALISGDNSKTMPVAIIQPSFQILRSPDVVVVCPNQAANLLDFQLDIGTNETYQFSSLFSPSNLSQGSNCWCLARSAMQNGASTYCSNANIKILANANETAWTNDPMTIYLNGTEIGECQAEPRQRTLYSCSNLH